MLRAQRSTPMALLAERAAGKTAVNDAIISAFAPCRTSSASATPRPLLISTAC